MNFNLNLAATLKTTEKKSDFLKVAPDTTVILRFLPPTLPNGSLFHLSVAHFGLESEDGKGTQVACLKEHADEPCPLCKLSYHLQDNGDKTEKKIGKDIKPSKNYYAQVLLREEVEDFDPENPEYKYTGPYKMRFSQTGVEEIQGILKGQQQARQPFACGIEDGSDIAFTRTGSGLDTKYKAMPTGITTPLSKIFPKWEEKIFKDLPGEVDSQLVSSEEMIALAVGSYPSLDWEEINEVIGG